MSALAPGFFDDGACRVARQCAGQTLLCRSLDLRIRDWDGRSLGDVEDLVFDDVGYAPDRVLVARRHGIPEGRDEHLRYRFVDEARLASAAELRRPRGDYFVLAPADKDPNGDGPTSS